MSNTFRKLINFPVGVKTTVTAVADQDIPNFAQIKSLIAGNLASKEAVAVEMHADFDFATGGLPIQDSYQLLENDRVLLVNQTDPIENGIYIASSGAWIRALDADEQSELAPHTSVTVLFGDHAGRKFELTNTVTPVVDTDAQTWVVTSASSSAAVDTTVDESNLDNFGGANVQAALESIDNAIDTTRFNAGTSFQRLDGVIGAFGENLGTFTGPNLPANGSVKGSLQALSDAVDSAAGTYAEGRYLSGNMTIGTGGTANFDHNFGELYPSSIEVYEDGTGELITHTLTVKAVSSNRVSVMNDAADVAVRVVIRK